MYNMLVLVQKWKCILLEDLFLYEFNKINIYFNFMLHALTSTPFSEMNHNKPVSSIIGLASIGAWTSMTSISLSSIAFTPVTTIAIAISMTSIAIVTSPSIAILKVKINY